MRLDPLWIVIGEEKRKQSFPTGMLKYKKKRFTIHEEDTGNPGYLWFLKYEAVSLAKGKVSSIEYAFPIGVSLCDFLYSRLHCGLLPSGESVCEG